MNNFELSEASWRKLHGVHPDLVYIVSNAIKITEVDFTVLEGVRTKQRQVSLVESGASKTLNSRHLTGHAVDLGAIIDGRVAWDWPLYYEIHRAMLAASLELISYHELGDKFTLEWGGNWKTFKDGPHFQLPWGEYP